MLTPYLLVTRGSVLGEGHGEPQKVGRTSLQRTITAENLVPAASTEVYNDKFAARKSSLDCLFIRSLSPSSASASASLVAPPIVHTSLN